MIQKMRWITAAAVLVVLAGILSTARAQVIERELRERVAPKISIAVAGSPLSL